MSYNFAFWSGGDDLTPLEVYNRLNDGHHVPGLAAVDRDAVIQAFGDHLPGWRWDGQFVQPPGTAPDDAPAFEVSIEPQMVEFVGYGWEPEHANAIIDAMVHLGMRLYDPQVDERFA